MKRRLLFRRDFQNYTGGHGKVLDYIGHADAHPAWESHVFLSRNSEPADNPFLTHPRCIRGEWSPGGNDVVFAAGEDWAALPEEQPARAVINLIQGTRHAAPDLALRGYLARPAVRICVSTAVKDAIEGTGLPSGPLHVIEPGLFLDTVAPPRNVRSRVFVYAHKQPQLGQLTGAALMSKGYDISIQTDLVPRAEFLAAVSEARIAVMLPHAEEGFFLPALEAMMLGCAVVVPDCLGNRAYARDGLNALVPPLALDPLMAAVERIAGDPALEARLVQEGIATATRFTLDRERRAFHAILDTLDETWAGM